MNKTVLTLLIGSVLSGCSLFSPKPPDVIVKPEPVPVICGAVDQKPEPLNLIDTPPTLVYDTETEEWGYWFNSELYASLAENLQAMRRYQQQQRAIRDTLIDCIEDHNATVPAEEES